MIVIHHLGVSQSDRIVWLCEELGVPYELKLYRRDPATGGGPADYKALTPFGTAPVIEDGPLVLGESAAITEYICRRYAGDRLIVAADRPNWTDYLFWFHFAQGSLMPAMLFDLGMKMTGVADSEPAKRLSVRSGKGFGLVEQRLGEAPFFAGEEFTAADILMWFPLTTMRLYVERDITDLPNLRGYLARIADRPAFQRAKAKADPDLPLKID